jgi:hypothetical protein
MAVTPNYPITWSTHLTPMLEGNPQVHNVPGTGGGLILSEYRADNMPSLTIDPNYPNQPKPGQFPGPLPASFEVACTTTGILLPRLSNMYVINNITQLGNTAQLLWYNVDTGLCQLSAGGGIVLNINATVAIYTSGTSVPPAFINSGTVTSTNQLYTDMLDPDNVPPPFPNNLSAVNQPTLINQMFIPLVEIRSSNSGILLPKLTNAYVTANYNKIRIPEAAGLLWYNTTLNTIQHCTGSFIYNWNTTPFV